MKESRHILDNLYRLNEDVVNIKEPDNSIVSYHDITEYQIEVSRLGTILTMLSKQCDFNGLTGNDISILNNLSTSVDNIRKRWAGDKPLIDNPQDES